LSKEQLIEILSIIISIGLFFIFVPKSKLREAIFGLLLMQSLTWVLGGLMVELKLISYPSHLFSYAFRTSFTFEYVAFPVVGVLFNLYFPKGSNWVKKTGFSILLPSLIVIGEVFLERYTDNIKYLHWNWFYSWGSMLMTLLLEYLIFRWFFKKYHSTQNHMDGRKKSGQMLVGYIFKKGKLFLR